MAELLKNLVSGARLAGKGPGTALLDPVTGTELARVALAFYHRRAAIQAEAAVIDALAAAPLVV